MKLEEAIETLKVRCEISNINNQFFGTEKAIETVLQALERLQKENDSKEKAYNDLYCEYKHYKQFESIPKKKMENKIKEYLEYDKKVKTYTRDGRENFTIEYYKAKTLQELLEENKMIVNCDEEIITITGDGFRINIDVEDGLELANKIQEYYNEEVENDN